MTIRDVHIVQTPIRETAGFQGFAELWNHATSMSLGLFIGANGHHHEFQRPEMRDSISEEGQKIWAETLNLHVERSKSPELISSSL